MANVTVRAAVLASLLAIVACAPPPRARALSGAPALAPLPRTAIPPGHSRIIFRWEFRDRFFSARGEGVARLAAPDSVRLDFFADGNMGGGYALLLGDSLLTPANGDARRYLPPVPMLWAALGRLSVVAADTIIRMDGDTLRADVGTGAVWRAGFVAGRLATLTRIEGGRLRESVRNDSSVVSYHHLGARRRLMLSIVRRVEDPPYDESIWRR